MDPFAPTPWPARCQLSGALIDADTCARRVLADLARAVGPSEGAQAREWLGAASTWSTGFSAVMQALATANDHHRAFARLLRSREAYGPSLAALCRAFVEVAGRAWWLLESADRSQLEHRAAAMPLKEISDSRGRTSGRLVRVADGAYEEVGYNEVLKAAQQDLSKAAVAGRKEAVPGYSKLAEAVMTAGGVKEADAKYSHLHPLHRRATGRANMLPNSKKPPGLPAVSCCSSGIPRYENDLL
ncbi:hypothetical protein [Microbacterium sp. A1-JK]|uniref:hypothetical protein n=1 Tax=Microbacterium sp. A1-JK TaxID=3177516 RepID=UPI0038877579